MRRETPPPLQDGAQFTGFEFELPEEPEGDEWFPDASVGQGAYILLKSTTPRECKKRKQHVKLRALGVRGDLVSWGVDDRSCFAGRSSTSGLDA